MLDMGFVQDVKRIIAKLPAKRQTLFFSATMPNEIKHLADILLTNPVKVEVTPSATTVDAIQQSVYFTEKHNKLSLLIHLLEDKTIETALIFTQMKHSADRLARNLSRAGIRTEAIHGNKAQHARQAALANFKSRKTRVLVATDIAARGIDIDDLTHVINFELPDDVEVYTHRSGRTGRAGKTGVCMSIVHAREIGKIRQIERMVQVPFHKVEIPSGKDVCRKQFFYFMDKLLQTDISHGDYETYLPMLQEKFQDISKEEVLKREKGHAVCM